MSLHLNSWHQRDARKFNKARQLLSPCIDEVGGVWADIGCGEGIFTGVLYELLGRESEIYAVDKNQSALNKLKQNFFKTYPDACIYLLHADFTRPLPLPPLDGLILANSLHFVKDTQKSNVLHNLAKKLKNGGKIIVVEYNTKRGNIAVPFPLSEDRFLELAKELNFQDPQIVWKAPSSFMGEMYAAIAFVP